MTTEESAVKVCVRVRPLIAREESAASENAKPVHLYWKSDKKSINLIDDGNSSKNFSFDRVFTAEETTKQLYQDIAKPLVVSSVEGYNGTIFAYGQTSSGKTFTMMGSDHIPGVIPLAVEDVFRTIKNFPNKEFLLRVSYMEIYNETVTDLLVDRLKRKPLEVRETLNKNIYVADLREELVTTPAQALAWVRTGEKNRHYGKTKMNERSSRSHAIFRMILESRERSDMASGENADSAIFVSHLNLVDLAGSERASQTGAEGTRLKEGCNINRSLFTLCQVIKKLTDESQKGFTNYRDSKLTRILQNSLGGNAKTVIICTVTPVSLDETLSTLQFASTAKKMKNDPHVTEVSDDEALLKRYRNEIVDLKRRLHEVSSVTQTTATEKEFLSQLLLEKDQLQREQQDRIKNLTKLLVTSANMVSGHKMPKRRVTWGGKMIKPVRPSAFGCSSYDLSFAEPFSRKKGTDRSSLMELGEEDEDFDSHWEIPDEPPDEMEMSQSSVTVRSFQDSPKDSLYEERMHEMSCKVSNLELQLERESQQREEAKTNVETLGDRVAELELQLQTEVQQKQEALEKMQRAAELELQLQSEVQQKQEALEKMQRAAELELQLQTEVQQKQEALEKVQTAEQRAAELELQLQTEVQQKQEATEQMEMLEFKVADLEIQLEKQSHTRDETDEQMRREFADAVQLCESLTSDKETMLNERDYLRQELDMFIERIGVLEKENASLSKELGEKKELDEFESLEEEFRKEHENDLQNQMCSLKKSTESSELQCLELQNKVETLSEELKKKSDFAEELHRMSGKDLVQEVATLRRSLDDAEGLSRETKKEWAVLRSQNITLEETVVNLTANHERMDAEVNSLRLQLETEKTRYRKMQNDLQKELNVVFDENTKLTTLLDGKVPKNLVDSVELERTVANLKKELTASHEAEMVLRAQLDELASSRALPDKVDNLMKQVCELTEELCAVQTQRDGLLSVNGRCQEEAQRLRDSLQTSQDEILTIQAELSSAALREKELRRETDSFLTQLESSHDERRQLKGTMLETEQQRASLEEKLTEMQQLMKDLEEKLTDSESSRVTEEEISKELQEQLNQLTEELQVLRAEKEQNAGAQRSAEEMENLLSTITSMAAEKDQLRLDLQENVQLAAERQVLLQSLQDDLQEQRQKNSDLVKVFEQKESDILSLSQQLQFVQDEKETLLISGQSSTEEVEKLLSAVTSLTEERDQLKMDLQENVEMSIEHQEELRTALEKIREQKDRIKRLETAQTSTQDGPPSGMSAQQEELQTHMKALTEDLERVRAERDLLLSERTVDPQTHSEEMEKLLCRVSSLSEERDQLQETLEGLRQEKQQLRAEMEDRMESIALAHGGFNQPEMLPSDLQAHDETVTKLQQKIEELQATLQTVSEQKSQLENDMQCNMEKATETQSHLHSLQQQLQEQNQRNIELESLWQERQAQLEQQVAETRSLLFSLREELQEQKQKNIDHMKLYEQKESDLQQQTNTLTEQLESARAERDALLFEEVASCQTSREEMEKLLCRVSSLREEMEKLLCRVSSLSEERDQLQEMLEGQRREKKQLGAELQDRMETLQNEIWALSEKLESVKAERDGLLSEKEASCQTSAEEMERLLCRVSSLSEERDQLQEVLEGLRREKTQLEAELEDRMELISTMQEELSGQKFNMQQQAESREREAKLQQQSVSDANATISALREQLSRLNRSTGEVKETASSKLQDSTAQLQESLRKFQQFIDTCAKYDSTFMDKIKSVEKLIDPKSVPKATMNTYSAVCQQTVISLGYIMGHLQVQAQTYRNLFKEMVKNDLAVFEERRLQDVLLCRAQAPMYSLKDEDFQALWERRLTELLDKRQLYVQKMLSISEKLWANVADLLGELSAENRERERLYEQLQAAFTARPFSVDRLDSILSCELEHRSVVMQSRKRTLQANRDYHEGLRREMEQLKAQTDSQLREERSKTSTLLQALEGAPLKTELSLLQDNQQLVLKLQQTEEQVRALRLQNAQLEDSQVNADNRVSNHKQATQLLQTELQDSRAEVEEKENTIRALRTKLRESEKNASPSAVELEKLRTKLFKMEVELSSASDQHQQEVQRMTTLLKEKEESLRKLKETLRRSQQQGDESILQGEDLCARLTNPRGSMFKSTVWLQKTKLEVEVHQLKLKITELESLVSSQQAEVCKWKNRAVTLKVKRKAEADKPSLPCTPTKRALPSDSSALLSSPRKFLVTPKKVLESPKRNHDSPKVARLESPKSRFFDGDGSWGLLSKTCPKQFFDNSSLGTLPEVSSAPETPDGEMDAAVDTHKTEESWPQSPKQEDICRTH